MAKPSRHQIIEEARMVAHIHGMFVVTAGNDFVVYRSGPGRNVRLGKRSSPRRLLGFVRACAGSR